MGFDADHTDATEYVRELDTYTERSPGGEGIHAIARGTKPGTQCRTGLYELYDRDRYLTVTGQRVAGLPTTVEERTAQIAAVYARLFPNGKNTAPAPSSNQTADDDLLTRAKAAKNSEKFKALWAGDTSGYPSHSEADAALCAMLAFWTNRDAAQMDRLFRRSGLLRPKWDERRGDSTYGAGVIAHAISTTSKGYTEGQPRDGTQVDLICAAGVKVMKIDWLYRARLAYGAITLVEGGPEKGKSTILCDFAARVTRGHSFPGETETREPGNVVMLIAEDDIATTVVPRLKAADADLSRIFFLGATKDEHRDVVPFHLSDDCDRLREKCQEVRAVFVVVDPLVSFLGSRKGRTLNTSNDLEVRKALAPLKELAEQLRASVAAIRHYRKGRGTDAIEAGGGSVGFSALVRVIVAALPDPEDDNHYFLAVAKNNLVAKSQRPALTYEIVPSEYDQEIGRIAWGTRTVEKSANEILQAIAEAEKNTTGKAADAAAFLEEFLADGEWKTTAEILEVAREKEGLSKDALKRAKENLPIVVEKELGKKDGKWGWRLLTAKM